MSLLAVFLFACSGCGRIWESVYGTIQCNSRYASAVLSDSPMGYWRLNEVVGPTAQDLGAGKNSAPYLTGVALAQPAAIIGTGNYSTFVTAAVGGTAQLNSFPAGTLDIGSNTLTAEMWIQPTSSSGVSGGIVAVNSPAYTRGFILSINESPCATGQFKVTKFGSPDICMNGWPNDSNKWHYVALVANTSGMTLYLDGNVTDSNTNTSNYSACGSYCILGIGYGGPQYTEEVAVYGTALSAARIQAHYQAGINCH